jgi:hypothetical protein
MYFDFEKPKETIKVCIKTCPNIEIKTENDLINFTKTNGNICLYNITVGTYDEKNCPKLPIDKT